MRFAKNTHLNILIALIAFHATSVSANPAGSTMNGISADQFGNFAKDWKLVTVRYRKDTGEMRWTYANDAALKVLEAQNSKVEYPDGAVFAKLGVMTQEDMSFPSSAVPGGTRRVQFMVRDKNKYASTDGWGYALFDAQGKAVEGDHAVASIACAACHRLVPQKGFVFSELMDLSAPKATHASWKASLGFRSAKRKDLPTALQALLPDSVSKIQTVTGPLTKNLFHGTLDEIRPLLSLEAARARQPVALVSESGKLFSVVIPQARGEGCAEGQMRMKGMHTVPNAQKPIFEISYCQEISR
jgi:hypothetical protein